MNVGRYEILKEVGRGAMGVVYQARDPNLDIVVALKVLRQDRVSSESFVHRFLAEARVLGRLDHPNIVRVYNVDRAGDTVFIAMEFVEGEALTDIMKRRRFSAEEIAAFGATAAEALDDAHRKGVVHRDVKPSNIIIRGDGRLKITDFGIAHIEDPTSAEQTQAGEILGTPAYMSPEQVLSRHVDGRSDLFSLGIILYELAAGVRPFTGADISAILGAITQDEAPELAKKNPAIPRRLSDAVMKCLSKDPAERFPNGRELAAVLRQAVAKRAEPSRPVPRRLIYYAAAALGFLAVVAALYLLIPRRLATAPPPPAVEKTHPSVLAVDSVPLGAELFVDGTLRGRTPAQVELPAGKHEVRLSAPRYFEWEAQVEVQAEVTTPLSVSLMPMQQQ